MMALSQSAFVLSSADRLTIKAWQQTRAQLCVLIQRQCQLYNIGIRLHDTLLRCRSACPGRYELPAVRSDGLSPLFEGLPGKGAGEIPDPNRPMGVKHLKKLAKANQAGDWQSKDTLWTKLCRWMPALLVNAAGGERVWGTLNRSLRMTTAIGFVVVDGGSVCA